MADCAWPATEARWIEVKRQATTAHSFGLEMHLLTPQEALDLWPVMDIDDLVGAAFLPTDGQANPSDITQSLASGARKGGVRICEDTQVTGFEFDGDTHPRGAHRPGPYRLRKTGDLRRAVVAAAGTDGGRQHSAGVGAAPVPGHRAHRRGGRAICRPCAIRIG